MLAVSMAQCGLVDMLINSGSSIDAQSGTGITALMKACLPKTDQHIDVAARLLNNGASVNIQDRVGRTALFQAIEVGDMKMIHLLLSRGADIDIKDRVS
jgi:ankyrin repeat protein